MLHSRLTSQEERTYTYSHTLHTCRVILFWPFCSLGINILAYVVMKYAASGVQIYVTGVGCI